MPPMIGITIHPMDPDAAPQEGDHMPTRTTRQLGEIMRQQGRRAVTGITSSSTLPSSTNCERCGDAGTRQPDGRVLCGPCRRYMAGWEKGHRQKYTRPKRSTVKVA